ncbi:hypothetical protein [uncultured Anaerococcus sp.]|uniref:hypothetical protein n=1 Tax=uncultured Anaerococcus sp. TaxID=293428 RepID=UPI002805C7B5|nr:hypothetical protein [uncultured Anaerococcus sp.]
MLNKQNYWIVEFNECGGDVKDYQGLEVTEELLDEFKILDEELRLKDDGYYKFYFDKYVDGVRESHIRIDIGSGVKRNQSRYDILTDDLKHQNYLLNI